MSGEITFSVIIPAYNAAKVVGDAISSCFAQKGVCEIIVVDDGSLDNTAEAARNAFSLNDSDMKKKVVAIEHGGLSAARNEGLKETTGEYVLFLDADDTLCEGAAEALAEYLGGGVEAVYPRTYYEFTEGREPVLREHFPAGTTVDTPLAFAKEVLIGMGRSWRVTAMLYSVKTLRENKICFAEGAFSEDYLFNLEFLRRAEKIAVCEVPTLVKRRESGSLSHSYEEFLLTSVVENDAATKNFLEETAGGEICEDDNALRHSLMMRSVVTLIFKYARYEKGLSMKDKTDFIKKLAAIPSVAEAINEKSLRAPYFSGRVYTEFYRAVYGLLKSRLYFAAAALSSWAAAIMKAKGR